MADYKINIEAQDNTKGAFSSINNGLAGLGVSAGKVKAAFAAAAGAFAIAGTIGKVTETIDSMDNLAKSARAAGAAASNEAFQGFQVMKQAMAEAGVEGGTFDRAMLNISQRMKEGSEGGKAFGGIFETLKGSITDANGELKSSPEILQEMINALNEGRISTDEFQKVVGGRAGPVINEMFGKMNGSAEALQATLDDVAANSNIVSIDAANNAEVFNDNIGRLKEGMGQLMTDAITPLLPMLVQLSEDLLAKMPAIISGVQTAFETLKPVLDLIGLVLTDVVAPILGTVFEVLGHIATAITPLVESAIPALKSAFEGLVTIVENIVGFFQGVAEGLQNIYNKAIQLKDGVGNSISNMADGVSDSVGGMVDGMKKKGDEIYQYWFGGSIFPDLRDGVIMTMEQMANGVISATDRMATESTASVEDLSKSIEQDFLGTLESALSDGKLTLSDFEGFFKNTMTSLLTSALSGGKGLGSIFSGIGGLFGGGGGGGLGSIFGGLFGGGGGGLFSGIGSLFGGFFSNGGYLSAGKVGIVGESGPELISGPATITPMDEAGGQTQVVFNINAIDTQTGTQFLLDNRKQIEGIIQNAYTRRGKEGIF